MSQPPIDDGAVRISQNRITALGRWKEIRTLSDRSVDDLGDVILMPGLINSHCHLDYTDMRGQIPKPTTFPDWIKSLLALKSQWTFSDYALSWLHGAKMLLRRGVTSVADIEAVPELLPEVWTSTPLRVFSFLEMTGVKTRRAPTDILRETNETIGRLADDLCSAGLSPHAPYSTTSELLRLSAESARLQKRRVTIHVSESIEEFEMFMNRRGPLFGWLKSQRSMSDCGGVSPIQHLARSGALMKNLIAVHVNYLAEGDATLLARRKVSVAHCPRSHLYFQHAPFPCASLNSAGVNVCLGTDSLVSVRSIRRQKPDLNMFAEMRAVAESMANLTAEDVVKMATLNGASALGLSGRLGQISPGALADLIVLPISAGRESTYEQVIQFDEEVAGSMIDGDWAIRPILS